MSAGISSLLACMYPFSEGFHPIVFRVLEQHRDRGRCPCGSVINQLVKKQYACLPCILPRGKKTTRQWLLQGALLVTWAVVEVNNVRGMSRKSACEQKGGHVVGEVECWVVRSCMRKTDCMVEGQT